MAKSPAIKTASGGAGRLVAYDAFIDQQLEKTSGQVRGVDIAGGILTLGIGLLGFFLVAALVDHWVAPGGLGFWGRVGAWTLLVAGSAWFAASQILPLLLRRINPVFAAQTIERSAPSLKNGLVNFLLLKNHRAAISEGVYEAIEAQAATGLAAAPVEAAIDRSRLIHLCCGLAALMLVGGFYKVLSPKDPLRTASRVLLPWADIDAPTRVTILNVDPGSATVFRNTQIPITVDTHGMPKGAETRLVWSSVDGQTVDQKITLAPAVEGFRYTCQLPEASTGVQQDLRYHVEAGDARSRDFTVTVLAAPTIVVRSIDYVFPEYTHLAPQRVEHQEDIKGIEGARVTLHAFANQPIASGGIDFDCNGREEKALKPAGQEATVEFTLELADDHHSPLHANYQLLFRNDAGQRNTQPVPHRIEVTPDLAPEIEFLAPKSPEIDLPVGASVGMEIAANDPDFELRRVRIVAASAGRQVFEQTLLDEPHRGQFNRKVRFGANQANLKPGDAVEYWAVAEDTKTPEPNRTETPRRRLRIVASTDQPAAGDQLASRDDDVRFDRPNDGAPPPDQRDPKSGADKRGGRERRSGDDRAANAQDGDRQPGEQPPTANADKNETRSRKPPDDRNADDHNLDKRKPDKNDGQQRSGEQPSNDDQPQPDQKGRDGKQRQPQDGQQGQDQAGGEAQQSGGAQQAGKQAGGGKNSGQQQAGQQQAGDAQSGDGTGGGQQQAGGKTGNKSGGKAGERPDSQSGDQNGPGQEGEKDRGANEGDRRDQGARGTRGANGDREDSHPVAADGSDDGSAIERILKHQDDKAKPQSQGDNAQRESRSDAGAKGDAQQQGDAQQPRDKAGPDNHGQQRPDRGEKNGADAGNQNAQADRSGDRASAEKDGAGGQNAGRQDPGARRAGDERAGGDRAGGEKADGEQAGLQKPAAEKRGGEKTGSERTADEKATGEQAGGQKAGGDKAGAERVGGEKAGGEKAGGAKAAGDMAGGEKAGGQKAGGAESGGEKADGQRGAGKRDRQPQNEHPPKADDGKPGDKPSDQPREKSKAEDVPHDQRRGGGEQTPEAEDRNQKSDGDRTGQGNRSKGDRGPNPQDRPPDKMQAPENQGGDGQDEKGESGAGKSGPDTKGSPTPQKSNRQQSKKQSGGGNEKKSENEGQNAKSPSQSERQSDSQGESEGDRSGGGGAGGGQKANKPGTGGAGQNTAADEGAGKANSPGGGETSDRPGGDQQADHRTGNRGSQPGKGSDADSGQSGGQDSQGKSGGASPEKQPGEPRASDERSAEKHSGERPKSDKSENPTGKRNKPSGDKSGQQPGAGQSPAGGDEGQKPDSAGGDSKDPPPQGAPQPGAGQPGPSRAGGQEPQGGEGIPEPPTGAQPPEDSPADEPNLAYARKATDMALERLKDQANRGETDPELLKRLGWSQQELRRFIDRWERMRNESRQAGPRGDAARRELDESLRSLGLRPRSATQRSTRGQDDSMRGLRESRRTQPPPEYADQLKAYTEGAARGGDGK